MTIGIVFAGLVALGMPADEAVMASAAAGMLLVTLTALNMFAWDRAGASRLPSGTRRRRAPRVRSSGRREAGERLEQAELDRVFDGLAATRCLELAVDRDGMRLDRVR